MIYDGFMFFNELDLLEIRLHELKDVVDRFILVESTLTHSGKQKPLYFANAKHEARFAPFVDRIEHVVAELPTGAGHEPSWRRENEQRRAIGRGFTRFGHGDLLLVSDADEIPSAEAVRRYVPGTGVAGLEQVLSYFYANALGGGWIGTRIVPYEEYIRRPDIQVYRTHLDCSIPRGGWHWSYLGGADRVREKLASFAHTELDTPAFMSRVDESVRDAKLIWDAAQRCRVVPVDDSFPSYLIANQERFAHLLKAVA